MPSLSKKSRLLFLVFSLCLTPVGFFYSWYFWGAAPPGEPQEFFVPKNMTRHGLVQALVSQNLVDSAPLFELVLWWTEVFPKLKSGTYTFQTPITPKSLVQAIEFQIPQPKVTASLTVPEGWTLSQILERIRTIPLADPEKLDGLLNQPVFLASFPRPLTFLEGFFYPSTYFFYEDSPSSEVVLRAGVDEFFKRLPPHYEESLKDKGLTLEEGVIFASLIERESSLEEEKPKIAEVIWNRLKAGIPLGVDASILYGLGSGTTQLTTANLQDASNPYNTRIHKGLPPTPIGSPSLSSLLSLLEPTRFGYYYYVLAEYGAKKHVFAGTLKEHNRNVADYVKTIQRQRRDRP
jgi:UPF0755 protein